MLVFGIFNTDGGRIISRMNSIRSVGAYSLINLTKYDTMLVIFAILGMLTIGAGDTLIFS